jgi:hypothetical protein
MSIFNAERHPKMIEMRAEEQQNPTELINFLSNTRHDQLTTYCSHNMDEINELERKFGKYLFVPLALPVFELPDTAYFLNWWSRYATRPNKIVSEKLSPDTNYVAAEAVDLVEKYKHYWTPNMQTDNFIKEFPSLWQQFNELLPFDDIITLHLWSSFRPFGEHRDPGELLDMPMSFRIKLYDENPEETLYFFDNPTKPYSHGDDTAVPSVPDTNSWAWNNLRVKHGSIYKPGYKKILVIATGILNPKKYEDLMNASISKYKEHCVLTNNTLENYVNT